MARIATEVKKLRAENPDTILIDAGDATTGTAFSTLTNGEAIFRVMNAVGYDATVYGNHEFDLGQDQARRFQSIARFPILACNILDKEGRPFTQEYAILKMGGLRVGVIGVANPETTNLVDKTIVPDLRFLPPESEIRRIQQELVGKADIVIILSHQGISRDISLAYKLIGVPLIVGGHSEIKLERLKQVNGVAIGQAGDDGYYLGKIDFSWDPESRRPSNFRGRLITIDKDIPEDPTVKQAADEEAKNLPPGLDQEIGTGWFSINRIFLGYWMAELLKAEGQADFGIMNTGGVRAEIYRGSITRSDVYDVMPFNDKLATFEIEGSDLMKVKGMRYFYFSRGPRIVAGRTYKVASIDFLIHINDFPGARNEQFSDSLLRDKIIERIEKDRGLKRFWAR
jgi:5'-nucleotidase